MTSVRARTVFSDQEFTISALESVELQTSRSNHGRFVTGSLRPIAVIVRGPHRTYALDMAAQPVDIERLELPDDFDFE